MSENPTNPADGKFIVVQGGNRVTGPLTEQEAKTEADRRNKLVEQTGKPAPQPPAQVKQNLFGAVTILLLPNVVSACATTFTNWL